MPRPAKYPDAASRQAAYRSRVYWQQPPTQKCLAGGAQGLHNDLTEAIRKGICPVPSELLGAHAGETLQNLRDYIYYGSLEAARKVRAVPETQPQ